ncbi:hypothetical protein KC963_05375 [Candidatus Saccharibacteria bacterium]|nr:hypothetical protein [Candidatus Saccharibacteria bacterium]
MSDISEFEKSSVFSGALLDGEELIVTENPGISRYEADRYRVRSSIGEFAVLGADVERDSEERDILVFVDPTGAQHTLMHGAWSGLTLDGEAIAQTA